MRLFYAIPMPEAIAAFQAELQARARALGMAAKWPRPQGLHLTLAFLGEQPETRLPELLSVGRVASACPAFELETTRLGGFPRATSARILWLGVEAASAMDTLCEILRHALGQAGVLFDPKPFSPHITLARPRLPADIGALGPAMATTKMAIDRFVLYRSLTEPQGPRYEVMEAFPLASSGL